MKSESSSTCSCFPTACWRENAARIVEELFGATTPSAWDALLDLRQGLLHGRDWNATLDTFLACREALEADHYLPFYRLRRLLAASLRLETVDFPAVTPVPLGDLLRRNPRSFAEVKRAARRELFERGIEFPGTNRVPLRVIEHR